MRKFRARVDVYVNGSYRVKGEVFNSPDDPDVNLIEVPPETEVGLPVANRTPPAGSLPAPSIAGTPTPQVVFDFDEPTSEPKPTNLDLFA